MVQIYLGLVIFFSLSGLFSGKFKLTKQYSFTHNPCLTVGP